MEEAIDKKRLATCRSLQNENAYGIVQIIRPTGEFVEVEIIKRGGMRGGLRLIDASIDRLDLADV